MEPATKEKLKQAIKNGRDYLKKLDDQLEETKKRKKEIEDEARKKRRQFSS